MKAVDNNKNEHKRQGKQIPLMYIYCDKIGHHIIIGIVAIISRHKNLHKVILYQKMKSHQLVMIVMSSCNHIFKFEQYMDGALNQGVLITRLEIVIYFIK